MFYGEFESELDLCQRFNIEASALEDCRILFAAYYEDECCGGRALVVFRRQHKLYEVNGSHCSCYGLEGQWEPELTTAQALEHRLENGTFGYELGAYEKSFRKMLRRFTRKRRSPTS